eukprot:COSAG05_NODE_846_length_6998_cov_2.530077_7_plen_52_part_00
MLGASRIERGGGVMAYHRIEQIFENLAGPSSIFSIPVSCMMPQRIKQCRAK